MFLKYHIGCFKDTNFAPVDPKHTHFQIESFESRLNSYFQIMSKWSFLELKIYWSIFIHLVLDKFIKPTGTDHFSSLGGLHQRIKSSNLSRCFFFTVVWPSCHSQVISRSPQGSLKPPISPPYSISSHPISIH